MADDTETLDAPTSDDVHARAIQRFDDIIVAVQEERQLALSDRRFVSIAGAQWEGDWAAQFANSIMVEVNKTAQGVEKIIADYRANRVTVNFRGVDKLADDQTAETMNGMFRADVYWSKGQQATDNAFEEAVQGGIGAWRLTNKYADDYDPESDEQRIAFEAIVDADQSVFWDPNARLYDKSDAKYAFIVTAMARGAFNEEYGADKVADWPEGILKTYYDWFTPDVVRIAEYFEVKDKTGTLLIFKHSATKEERREWATDLDADDLQQMRTEGWQQVKTRKAKRCQVWKTILSGADVLVPAKVIAGDNIPIVPVYGKRWFIDNMERSRGHVRLAKDPQRIYNAQISKLTETAALAPTERPIFTPEQVAGHADEWAKANIKRAPYSLINPITLPDGSPFVGPVAKIEPPQLSPVLSALVQITAQDIADLTSADDGADQTMSNVSAEAMDIAATRTDAKSGIYMDNMRQSTQRAGEIWLSMAREVYFEEGREVETMGDNGEQGTAVLAEPHTDDTGKYSIRNDIGRGKYKVISDVTEATATRRDKTVKTLVNVAQIAAATDPELSAAALSTALINMDGEGMTDLQDWMRARLVKQGVVKPTKEEQAQLDQASQQQQQPDPTAIALQAVAEKDTKLADKASADAGLSRAKTAQILAEAHQGLATGQHAQDQHGIALDQHGMAMNEHKMGMIERLKGLFAPQQPKGTQ